MVRHQKNSNEHLSEVKNPFHSQCYCKCIKKTDSSIDTDDFQFKVFNGKLPVKDIINYSNSPIKMFSTKHNRLLYASMYDVTSENLSCLSQLTFSLPQHVREHWRDKPNEYYQYVFQLIPHLPPSDAQWLITQCLKLHHDVHHFQQFKLSIYCVYHVLVHKASKYVHPISDDMELNDFSSQDHSYLCYVKDIQNDEMIKIKLPKIEKEFF